MDRRRGLENERHVSQFRAELRLKIGLVFLPEFGDICHVDLVNTGHVGRCLFRERHVFRNLFARWSVVLNAEAFAFIVAPTMLLFFPLAVPPIDDVVHRDCC